MLNSLLRFKQWLLYGNYIRNPRNIETNYLESPIRIEAGTYVGKNVHIGRYTYIGKNNFINSSPTDNPTSIGRFCSIASNVTIGAGDHPSNWLSTSAFQYNSDDKLFRRLDFKTLSLEKPQSVIIGNDVWIGSNAFIKAGVKVGDGAIIGAGAIVVKDVLPFAIVAGCPARLIRYRFDHQTIDQLLSLAWWELNPKLIKNVPFNDTTQAIECIKGIRTV